MCQSLPYPAPLLDLRRLDTICRRMEQEHSGSIALVQVGERYFLTGDAAELVSQALRTGITRRDELSVCEWTSWGVHVRVLPWLGRHYSVRLVTLREAQLEVSEAVSTVAALLRHPCFSARWVSCLHKQLGLARDEQLDELEQILLARRDGYDDRLWAREWADSLLDLI